MDVEKEDLEKKMEVSEIRDQGLEKATEKEETY